MLSSEDKRGKERKSHRGMLGNLYRYGLALVKIFWRPKDYLKSF